MTLSSPTQPCRWCGRAFPKTSGPGRPRLFCAPACRQRDYISRLRAQEAGLAESELVITRRELEELRDKLFVLECAIEDARRDLGDGGEAREALEWVIDAAMPLLGVPLGEGAT